MKHQTLRISFSILLLCASLICSVQLFMHEYGTEERFLLVVQVLLFVFLSSANYSDRKKRLLGQRKTHLTMMIFLSIVLSVSSFLLLSKTKRTSAFLMPANSVSAHDR